MKFRHNVPSRLKLSYRAQNRQFWQRRGLHLHRTLLALCLLLVFFVLGLGVDFLWRLVRLILLASLQVDCQTDVGAHNREPSHDLQRLWYRLGLGLWLRFMLPVAPSFARLVPCIRLVLGRQRNENLLHPQARGELHHVPALKLALVRKLGRAVVAVPQAVPLVVEPFTLVVIPVHSVVYTVSVSAVHHVVALEFVPSCVDKDSQAVGVVAFKVHLQRVAVRVGHLPVTLF
mmetsp:Transcript_19728/g.37585  ORF Transcript_19728/g.37585 Transcript_19728/m.37585 type:complete len:231 (-) Transcript_19728:539-1231(-)